MAAAQNAPLASYLPPPDIASDLDKQHELRKRKMEALERGIADAQARPTTNPEKRAKVVDGRLPPRPQLSVTQWVRHKDNQPPDWETMNVQQRAEFRMAAVKREQESRVVNAVRCINEKVFPNSIVAAQYFRLSPHEVSSLYRAQHAGDQAATKQAIAAVPAPVHADTASATKIPTGPKKRAKKANTIPCEPQAPLPKTIHELCSTSLRRYKNARPSLKANLRRIARKGTIPHRLSWAVLCFNRGDFNSNNDAAQFFDIPLSTLKERLKEAEAANGQKQPAQVTSQALPPTQAKATPQAVPRNTQAKANQRTLPSTTSGSRTMSEDSSTTDTWTSSSGDSDSDTDSESDSESDSDCEPDKRSSSAAPTPAEPFTPDEELALVEEIHKRALAGRRPTIARIRDIANARVLKRDGLSAQTLHIDWVLEFAERHRRFAELYALDGVLPPTAAEGEAARAAVAGVQPEANGGSAGGGQEKDAWAVAVRAQAVASAAPPITGPLAASWPWGTPEPSDWEWKSRSPEFSADDPADIENDTADTSTTQIKTEECITPISHELQSSADRKPQSPPDLSSTSIETRLRVTHGDDTRVIAVAPDPQFAALMERVQQKFGTQRAVRLQLADGDGMVTVGDQEDLDIVLADTRKWAVREGKDVVQLQVYVKEI